MASPATLLTGGPDEAAPAAQAHPFSTALVGVVLLGALAVYADAVVRWALLQWDDAFITFRFARNLAEGHGLVWNLGQERVEGFSSMLHVLLLAAGARLGISPTTGATAISVLAVLASVGFVLGLVRRSLGRIPPVVAVLMALYLVDRPTAIHTTSGLETQVFVAMLMGLLFAADGFARSRDLGAAIAVSVLSMLTVLTRPESALYVAAIYAVLTWHALRWVERSSRPPAIRRLGLSVALLAVLGGAYAVWKLAYFGYLLPNSYYVKSVGAGWSGARNVGRFLEHVAIWFGPVVLGFTVLGAPRSIARAFRRPATRALALLAVVPSLVALGYYAWIVHEVGGAHRFSYPTMLGLVTAGALALGHADLHSLSRRRLWFLTLVCAVGLVVPPVVQRSRWSPSPVPDPISRHHRRIAEALASTGLEHRATVIVVASGEIPYVSRFNQVDPVGLTTNALSGRSPLTPAEREAYLWGQGADVYFGFEPPASPGASSADADPRMNSSYLVDSILERDFKTVEGRMLLRDRDLLHARMRRLRDDWSYVGEMRWPGRKIYGLRSFVYVRKASPHAETLAVALRDLAAIPPEALAASLAE